MAEALTFLMGKFPAVLPGELRYARNHMWAREEGAGLRFGFTSYAIRLMKDVYFLDWCISAGDAVDLLQQIGNIETSKAVSDLFAPVAGTVCAFNAELLKDPSGINVDGYDAGWLFEMERANGPLLSVVEYHEYLTANWEKTQHIKGKINTETKTVSPSGEAARHRFSAPANNWTDHERHRHRRAVAGEEPGQAGLEESLTAASSWSRGSTSRCFLSTTSMRAHRPHVPGRVSGDMVVLAWMFRAPRSGCSTRRNQGPIGERRLPPAPTRMRKKRRPAPKGIARSACRTGTSTA